MRRNRIVHVLLAMAAGFGLLLGRLLWIQASTAISANKWAAHAVRQRMAGVTVDTGRGDIVDRNGRPLAGYNNNALLLLPGGAERVGPEQLLEIGRVLGVPPDRLLERWRAAEAPVWWTDAGNPEEPAALTDGQAAAIRSVKADEAVVVAAIKRRHTPDRPASHLVGFVAQQPERMAALYPDRLKNGRLTLSTPIGASGLELAFDRLLLGGRRKEIAVYSDGSGRMLEGLGIRTVGGFGGRSAGFYPLKLVSTLDSGIQRDMERLADEHGLQEGAVVVLDAHSADVLAMVSRPFHPAGAADPRSPAWINRGLAATVPGSVVKTFIAAVALEEHAVHPGELFHCSGSYGKYGMLCWKKGGHGRITFEEALARSCNIAFAEVGERLSGDTLQRYAEQLGMAGTVGWRGVSRIDGRALPHMPEEQPSRLFAADPARADGGMRAQTAIGQRDARLSPLAAANWMVTLLHHGKVSSPRAAGELRFANGRLAERYAPMTVRPSGSLSPRTVAAVRRMMERVVADGTGSGLSTASWRLAGKSGTAELGIPGRTEVNQWFVGYGPAQSPRYAVAVVAERRPANSANRATALFKAAMDALAEAENRP